MSRHRRQQRKRARGRAGVKPLGILTVEQDGAVVRTEEFDSVALDTNLAPRAAELRFRALHVGAELWPELTASAGRARV